ncbi:hypothetical protein JYT36_00220 [Bacteroidales bacterium AH-315-N07]|nr:hypothetical protein [Bacteroidales bacterium AH-315-N07]
METQKLNVRFSVLAGMILLAALSRLLPHPPNFTPIAAMALFGGAYFMNKKWSFGVPIMAMIISDLGLVWIMNYEFFIVMRVVIYGCFILITLIGFLLRGRVKIINVVLASLAGSILFFIITNFAVWAGGHGNFYPISMSGLIQCYATAIPFFRNTLLGDLVYVGVLFGAFEMAKYRFPVLSKA